MDNPFKIGDKVICIANWHWEDCLTVGKVYEVLRTNKEETVDGETFNPEIKILDDSGLKFFFDCTRFAPLKEDHNEGS